MDTMKAAVPGAFDTALKNYLKQIDASSAKIESTFQEVLNQRFPADLRDCSSRLCHRTFAAFTLSRQEKTR